MNKQDFEATQFAAATDPNFEPWEPPRQPDAAHAAMEWDDNEKPDSWIDWLTPARFWVAYGVGLTAAIVGLAVWVRWH